VKYLAVTKESRIFAGKLLMIGDRIMNKVLINSNIHDGAASIAKPSTPKFTETTEFKEALAYVKTMVSKGGKPVPADANGLDALVEKKYAL